VGPADQQLRSDDWSDAGLGQQCRTGWVLLEQLCQFAIEFGGLIGEEPDPSGDRVQRDDGDAVLGAGVGSGVEAVGGGQLLGQGALP